MPKEKSPLRVVQREGDTLKKEIDAYMEECELVLEDSTLKDRTARMKKLFQRCKNLRKKCKAIEKKVEKLSKGKEPTVIPNFNDVKERELERMQSLEVRLQKVGSKLEPDEVEESYFRKVSDDGLPSKKPANETVVEDLDGDDEEDDDDDDDSENEENDSKMETSSIGNTKDMIDTTGENEEEEEKEEEEEEDGEDEKDQDERNRSKSKFSRKGLFRRSKSPTKATGKLEKIEDDVDKGKKGKQKEKTDKERERERKEQEKLEKKEKERLEKEKKDKEKKEQKEREKEEKRKKKEQAALEKSSKSGKKKKGMDEADKDQRRDVEDGKEGEQSTKKSFGAKLFSRDSKKAKTGDKHSDTRQKIDGEEEQENICEEEEEEEIEEMEEEEEEEEEEDDDAERDKNEEEEEEEEEEGVEEEEDEKEKVKKEVDSKSDKKAKWSLFRRNRSPQRQVKKENDKDEKKRKENDKKKAKPQEAVEDEVEEEDDDEDDDEDDEEEEEEDEDEDEDEEEDSEEEKMIAKEKQSRRKTKVEEESEEDEELEEEEEEEDDDEDDDEEDDEEEEEEESDEGKVTEEDEEEEIEAESDESEELNPPDEGENLFEAVCDFDGEEDDDLNFKKGAVLNILSVREDGWWMAEDEEGNKGLVPSTYLKLKKDYNDHRDLQSPETDEPATTVSPRSGKELWRGLKKAVNETGVTDVLSAMGAIPSGFRPSTTARHLKSESYTLCNFLKLRFTESRLGFRDLNWSPHENQIRAKTVRMQKLLTILMVRNVPPCGVGIEIRSRHVRICFFDGDKILSNIHTVQATWSTNDPKTWRFSPKVTALLPSILDGDCFIRSSRTEENTGLLFELCLSYIRPKTGERGELSCGWVHLPLYDATTGAPIMNKLYDLSVHGGTPFEQDVEVDPSISRRSSSSKFRAMMSANKQPRLQLKLLTPTKEQKPLLDLLPETIISSLSYLQFLTFFRKIQADEVLRDRIDLQNADLIHSPVLATFPEATKYPDVMDALRSCWADHKAKLKKIDKKDQEQLKILFNTVFMESVYPILKLQSLPPYKWADEDRDSERWQVISQFLQNNKQKGILDALLAPGGEHPPFDMSEVAYNLLDSFQELS